jgi:hypothetical protein
VDDDDVEVDPVDPDVAPDDADDDDVLPELALLTDGASSSPPPMTLKPHAWANARQADATTKLA